MGKSVPWGIGGYTSNAVTSGQQLTHPRGMDPLGSEKANAASERANEMDSQVLVSADNTDKLSLIPGTHMVERKS